ncbi:hypothetical protein BC826DRAFT_1109583 [Russula brevipes]|nr:hypothetical protein BC826DRAFT_1109583 [Russula brevipes]
MSSAHLHVTALCAVVASALALPRLKPERQVLIDAHFSGILAAWKLTEEGITNLIVEARDELGRELDPGTQEGSGPANPTVSSRWLASTTSVLPRTTIMRVSVSTYDNTGAVDDKDVFNNIVDAFSDPVIAAGARVQPNLTARAGYSLIDQKPKTPHEKVSEYFIFDWEYSQTPEQPSLAASSWGNNFTYDVSQGGFSDDNLLSIDQRGLKARIAVEEKTHGGSGGSG